MHLSQCCHLGKIQEKDCFSTAVFFLIQFTIWPANAGVSSARGGGMWHANMRLKLLYFDGNANLIATA